MAISFEGKTRRKEEKKIVIECVHKRKGNIDYKKIKTEEKELFLAQNGYSSEGLKVIRECGINIEQVVRERERSGQWMEGKIRTTRYNLRYKEVMTVGRPKYLREKGKEGEQRTIAR